MRSIFACWAISMSVNGMVLIPSLEEFVGPRIEACPGPDPGSGASLGSDKLLRQKRLMLSYCTAARSAIGPVNYKGRRGPAALTAVNFTLPEEFVGSRIRVRGKLSVPCYERFST